MEKLESRYKELKANGENKYLESLAADSRVPYNLNDVKLNSSNGPTSSADRKYLAYMIELWTNIKSSSDMNKKKEEFEKFKIEYFLLTEYFLSQNRPIKLKEYFKLSKIFINSGVIPQNKLTPNKKILIKV